MTSKRRTSKAKQTRLKRRRPKHTHQRGAPQQSIPVKEANAAGIDVGAREMYVAIPADRDAEPVRVFRELSASLHDSGRSGLVTSVVMPDRARRTDYDPQDAVGCTGRDATNLPAI